MVFSFIPSYEYLGDNKYEAPRLSFFKGNNNYLAKQYNEYYLGGDSYALSGWIF